MSEQSFYVELTFFPKRLTHDLTFTIQFKVLAEVYKDLVQRNRSELIKESPRGKAIALDLARRAALATFSTGAEQVALPFDEDAMWHEDRHHVVSERPCDYEEYGIRVWRID